MLWELGASGRQPAQEQEAAPLKTWQESSCLQQACYSKFNITFNRTSHGILQICSTNSKKEKKSHIYRYKWTIVKQTHFLNKILIKGYTPNWCQRTSKYCQIYDVWIMNNTHLIIFSASIQLIRDSWTSAEWKASYIWKILKMLLNIPGHSTGSPHSLFFSCLYLKRVTVIKI